MLKHTLILLVSIVAIGFVATAQAKADKSLAFAADVEGAKGGAKYEITKVKDVVVQTLVVDVRIDAEPGQPDRVKIIIDGRSVGVMKIDESGRGRLELDDKNKPDDAGRLIPIIRAGSTIHAADQDGKTVFKGVFKEA